MFTTYTLIFEKTGSSNIRLRTRSIYMEEGLYLYVGSAKRGLEKRISRHLSKRKKRFWHIDYITTRRDVAVRAVVLSTLSECKTLRTVSSLGTLVGNKLGSSDCACPSHVVHVTEVHPDFIMEHLGRLGFMRFSPA
jgi:Uri superfamily endonuclease